MSNLDAFVTVHEKCIQHLTISFEIDALNICKGKLYHIVLVIWSDSQTLYCSLHSQTSFVGEDKTTVTTQVSYSIIIFQFTIFTYDK